MTSGCASSAASGLHRLTRQSAFTLIEVLASLLIIALGMGSALGMSLYAIRLSGEAQVGLTATRTALTVLTEPEPLGRTADLGDADGDGWRADRTLSGLLSAPSYSLNIRGYLNGYWVDRQEMATSADRISATQRMVTVTVSVYWSDQGKLCTQLRRRMLRQGPMP
jgi:prepilin-type N-terminal cleavage/methylation domain-containing protein